MPSIFSQRKYITNHRNHQASPEFTLTVLENFKEKSVGQVFHKVSSCYSYNGKRKEYSKEQKFGNYITNKQFMEKVICRSIPVMEKMNKKEQKSLGIKGLLLDMAQSIHLFLLPRRP